MNRALAGLSILTLAAPVLADTPSYNYIEGLYQRVEFDTNFGSEIDGDGFAIGGSLEVAENWHMFGGYGTTGLDFSIDLNQFTVGGGYHVDISPISSFFVNLAYVRAELDAGGFGSPDDSGYGLTIGLRSRVSQQIDLEGSLGYVDLGDGSDGTTLGGAALYRFSDMFSAGLFVGVEEDILSYGLGGRVYFDR